MSLELSSRYDSSAAPVFFVDSAASAAHLQLACWSSMASRLQYLAFARLVLIFIAAIYPGCLQAFQCPLADHIL